MPEHRIKQEIDPGRLERTIGSFPEVKLAYLFGSRADGSAGPLSDYDVGVVLERGGDSRAILAALTHELCKVLATDSIDVVCMNRAAIELNYAIISGGNILYRKSLAEKVEYEARVLGLYGDYLPVLRSQMREISAGGRHADRVQRYREALGRTRRSLGKIGAA